MERLKVWLNQQIAKILGDLQELEPVEDPSPTRAGCRIFFMVSLLLGFSLLLVYTFIDAPDTRVVQIHRLTPGDKNHAFPSCFLYDRNSTKCKKWSKARFPVGIPVSCPCTNASAPWKNFVNFHELHETSTDWNMSSPPESSPDPSTMSYPPEASPGLFLPYNDINLMPLRPNENIVKDPKVLTAEKFCNLSYLGPSAIIYAPDKETYKVRTDVEESHRISAELCVWMATLLFPGSNTSYEGTRSTQFLNTQSLLNREGLNTLVAQLARESVLTRQLALDMAVSVDVGNDNIRRFSNALAQLLTGLLDRDEMDPMHSYHYGKNLLSETWRSNQFYDNKSMVWSLRDDSGPIFLQPEIKWEDYRQTCNPKYCEMIKHMGGARKLFWAFGTLGGVATIVLAVVTTLLWPCAAMLLLWISKRKTAENGGPRTAQGVLAARPEPLELSSPLPSKILNSETPDSEPHHAEGTLDVPRTINS